MLVSNFNPSYIREVKEYLPKFRISETARVPDFEEVILYPPLT